MCRTRVAPEVGRPGGEAETEDRTMLLTNGRIYTLDARDSVVDALVIRDGRVAFAGRRRDVTPQVGEVEVDVGGRAVLPGPVDAHGHLMWLARKRLELDV